MEKISSGKNLALLLNEKKHAGRTVSFVPTMGALHDGHKSCMEIGRKAGDILVASIFVNPTQFAQGEDLDKYPRPLEEDLKHLLEWGCDLVFTPSTSEMYNHTQSVWVDVGGVTEGLCGRFRPGHFMGVATVVAKLFNMVQPDVAVFGQKDAQQAVVIKRMVEQLNFPVKLLLSPVVRDAYGLAMSSRNDYLSSEERKKALGIFRGLVAAREVLEKGERSAEKVAAKSRSILEEAGLNNIDYVEVVDAENLHPVDPVMGKVLLAIAARVGETRLIDNMVFEVGDSVREAMLF